MNKNKTVWVISGGDDNGIWEPEVYSSYDNAREALVKYAREFMNYYSNVKLDGDVLKYGDWGGACINSLTIDGGYASPPNNNEFRIPISGTLIVSENPDPDCSGASILFETANGNTVDIAKFIINVDNIDNFLSACEV